MEVNQPGNRDYHGKLVLWTVNGDSLFFLSWLLALPSESTSAAECLRHGNSERVCILGAFPFAVMGFIRYHGMTAEQFFWAYFKSEFILPKNDVLSDKVYFEALSRAFKNRKRRNGNDMIKP